MLIANPLYDVVFKYLLDDNKVAKLFIGAILGVEITELEFKPQEIPLVKPKVENSDEISSLVQVLRIDFKAQITYPNGTSMLVLIELQKAKEDTDLMRFRRYLGSQYSDSKNIDKKNNPLPIINIYFLGYTLKNFEQIPIIRVKRQCIDNFNQEILKQKEPFIEALSHDSIVIQIPQIKHKRRNELEEILTIFEDGNKKSFDMKYTLPEKYEVIAKRLNRALTDEQLRYAMVEQDEMIKAFETKDKALAAAQEKLKIAVQNLKKKEMSTSEIAVIFNLSKKEIEKLLL